MKKHKTWQQLSYLGPCLSFLLHVFDPDNPDLVRILEHSRDLPLELVQGRLVHFAVVRGLGPIVQLQTGGQVFATSIHNGVSSDITPEPFDRDDSVFGSDLRH